MTPFTTFLQNLFDGGQVVLRERLRCPPNEETAVRQVLQVAFDRHRHSVASPLLRLDSDTALAASRLLADACWFLVSHNESDSELEQALVMPGPPLSPEQHLSADLAFRYLPVVHRRARALAPDDTLTRLLTDVLRQWPLSGVLSDVVEEPTTPLQFSDHPGLLLLYAERLAQNDRPAWRPTTGLARETMELVLAGLEKSRERQHRGPAQPGSG